MRAWHRVGKSGWENGAPPCSPVLRGRPPDRGLWTYPDVVFAVPRLPSVPDGQADGEEEQQDAGPHQDVSHREGLVPVQEPFVDVGLVLVAAGRQVGLGAEAEAWDQVPDGHDDSKDQHPQTNGRQGVVGATAGPGLGHPQQLSEETQWIPSSFADEGPGLGSLRRSRWENGIWRKRRDQGQIQVKNIPGKAAGAELKKLKFGLTFGEK